MRIATYTRISTDEDRQPFSLGAQQERLDAYAQSQDSWRVVARYSDQASGATLDRPGLNRALADARSGVFELLLVYRVDRLSRNVRQLAQLSEELDKVGVALRSATEPFDTSSAAGKMMLQMLGVFAEFERRTIVDRITAGMERAASQGRWVSGRPPYGYTWDKDAKMLIPEPAQAEIVRRIFSMYVEEHMGADAIGHVLAAEGHGSRNGIPFAAPAVLQVLSNPLYAGKITFRGEVYEGLHDPLIGNDASEAAARILSERGESQALKRGHASDYLLSGVVRCGRCERAFIGTSAKGRSRLYHYYTCSTRYRYGTSRCDADRLPREALEEAVIEQMAEVYQDSSLVADALAEDKAAERHIVAEAARRIATLRQELAGARRALDRYFAAFEDGSLAASDCQHRIRTLNERLDALIAEEQRLEAELRDRRSEAPTADEIAQWAAALPELLTVGSAQQRKALVRKLVKEIRVMGRDEIVPTYRIPPLVRAPQGWVGPAGLEPATNGL